MKLYAAHTFADVDVTTFAACYFDEAFNEALCAHTGLQRQVVHLRRDGEALHRAVHIVPDRTLPKPVAKLLGADKLGYTEQIDYVFGQSQAQWRIVADVMADKVKSMGSVTFTDDGNGGVVRVVDGEVTVRIFGLGGTIERVVVADAERSFAEAAAFMTTWLRERR